MVTLPMKRQYNKSLRHSGANRYIITKKNTQNAKRLPRFLCKIFHRIFLLISSIFTIFAIAFFSLSFTPPRTLQSRNFLEIAENPFTTAAEILGVYVGDILLPANAQAAGQERRAVQQQREEKCVQSVLNNDEEI